MGFWPRGIWFLICAVLLTYSVVITVNVLADEDRIKWAAIGTFATASFSLIVAIMAMRTNAAVSIRSQEIARQTKHDEMKHAEVMKQREIAAKTIGFVHEFLTDIEPDRVGTDAFFGELKEEFFGEQKELWRTKIRSELYALYASGSNDEIRSTAKQLAKACDEVVSAAMRVARDEGSFGTDKYDKEKAESRAAKAKELHLSAVALADQLSALLRDDRRESS